MKTINFNLRDSENSEFGTIGTFIDAADPNIFSRVKQALEEHFDADVTLVEAEVLRCCNEIQNKEGWAKMSISVTEYDQGNTYNTVIVFEETWMY